VRSPSGNVPEAAAETARDVICFISSVRSAIAPRRFEARRPWSMRR
jgi:hypothetical protein